MKNIAAFDAADYLDNDIVIAEYLNAALEDENPNVFLQAIADVAKARGMTKLAKDTGLGREGVGGVGRPRLPQRHRHVPAAYRHHDVLFAARSPAPDGAAAALAKRSCKQRIRLGAELVRGEIIGFVEKDGKYFIEDMKRKLPEFRLLIGDVDAELAFLFAGKELDLKKSLERGKIYTFRAQRLSIYQQLEGVNIYE